MEKYHLLYCQVTPNMCDPIKVNIVISQDLQEFLIANYTKDRKYQKFVVMFWTEVSKEIYTSLVMFNPNDRSYFALIKCDQGK